MSLSNLKQQCLAWTEGFVNLIFPNLCTVCQRTLVRGERIMCLECRVGLPVTNLHRFRPNHIHERLFSIGHPIENATSLFYYYRENKYSRLIHDTKYRGRPIVGKTLAEEHSRTLVGDGFFDDVDLIVPVPLHPLKQLQRGYNQAEEIALGISAATALPLVDALAASYHRTQTRKNAHERLLNTRNIYRVKNREAIENKHILLVDDVITTGATLLSCMEAIKSASPSTRISIYSLAITQLV
ncbi:ComF family protein [uncultured Duncaniella sp.]|uniref:ComF family protein n=2 Tax=uncultured Duncaniella sp. TaxID=2768039 RepID=UPI0026095547|nr:ComF family protein [uncultured Duncaniella sp.]